MKKGYYIHFEGRQSIGVSKKIDMQLEEFRNHFDIEELEIRSVKRSLVKRLLGLFPTASITREYDEAIKQISDPDFIYVRRTVCDRAYMKFWKRIKQEYPDCKIIIELFTYPYDKDDFYKWNAWPFLIKEWIYRSHLKKYIDRFVTYSTHREILGIPAIATTNGIIVDKVKRLSGETLPGTIRLIAVAYMQRQHGYERVIQGLADYYSKKDNTYRITLDLVGDGPEKERYWTLVEKSDLGEYVRFFPKTVGDELDALYDQADIAVGVFANYKVGYYEPTGALKTRECLAKGIPMISGTSVMGVDDDFIYIEFFANDPSTVDMNRVIDLYERSFVNSDRQKVADEIRKYAREHVSMDIVMKPIIDFIQ